jgi:hypothetical protein
MDIWNFMILLIADFQWSNAVMLWTLDLVGRLWNMDYGLVVDAVIVKLHQLSYYC